MISVVIPSRNELYLNDTVNDILVKAKDKLMIGIIYIITNKITGKQYVGQTIQKLNRRWGQHITNAKNGLDYLIYRSMRKHGVENFWRGI